MSALTWELNRETFELILTDERGRCMYAVDLERCRTSAEILDWIFQVSGKTWVTPRATAELVRCLDCIFHPQEHLCSFGREGKPLTADRIKRLVEVADPI